MVCALTEASYTLVGTEMDMCIRGITLQEFYVMYTRTICEIYDWCWALGKLYNWQAARCCEVGDDDACQFRAMILC